MSTDTETRVKLLHNTGWTRNPDKVIQHKVVDLAVNEAPTGRVGLTFHGRDESDDESQWEYLTWSLSRKEAQRVALRLLSVCFGELP
jgi:hypothetical protein